MFPSLTLKFLLIIDIQSLKIQWPSSEKCDDQIVRKFVFIYIIFGTQVDTSPKWNLRHSRQILLKCLLKVRWFHVAIDIFKIVFQFELHCMEFKNYHEDTNSLVMLRRINLT